MVYGFLDNVCGDFFVIFSGVVFHAVVFRDMWSNVGVVGFRPSGVRTAFEQQTGSFLML